MFTTHFKMSGQPFLENTAAQHMLKDDRITEGLARLTYLASHGTLACLRAERTGRPFSLAPPASASLH